MRLGAFTPLRTGPILEYRDPADFDVADIPISPGVGRAHAAAEGLLGEFSPFRLARDFVDRQFAGGEMLSPEQANARFAVGDLKFAEPIEEGAAQDLYNAHRATMRRADIIRRSGIGGFQRFVYSMGASMLDPINVASAFVPGYLFARVGYGASSAAGAAARLAARTDVGRRTLYGAAEGAVGMAALTPAIYALAQAEHRNYTVADAFIDIAFGTALGAGLHGGIASIRRWRQGGEPPPVIERLLDDASPAERQTLVRGAVANVAEGRPVDVAPMVADIAERRARGLEPEGERLARLTDEEGAPRPGVARPASAGMGETAIGAARLEAARAELRTAQKNLDTIAGEHRAEAFAEESKAAAEAARAHEVLRTSRETPALSHEAQLAAQIAKAHNDLATAEAMRGKAPAATVSRLRMEATAKLQDARRRLAAIRRGPFASEQGPAAVRVTKALERLRALREAPVPPAVAAAQTAVQKAQAALRAVEREIAARQQMKAAAGIAARNAEPYFAPEDVAASAAADEIVAAAPPIRARTPEQGIGAESPEIREHAELDAAVAEDIASLRSAGALTEAEEAALAAADDAVRQAETVGKARDLAALCLAGIT